MQYIKYYFSIMFTNSIFSAVCFCIFAATVHSQTLKSDSDEYSTYICLKAGLIAVSDSREELSAGKI